MYVLNRCKPSQRLQRKLGYDLASTRFYPCKLLAKTAVDIQGAASFHSDLSWVILKQKPRESPVCTAASARAMNVDILGLWGVITPNVG